MKNTLSRDIAIVGMACRLPGADNLTEFWNNLVAGVESIHFFTDEELNNAGVTSEQLQQEKYIKAAPIINDYDRFDHQFFECSPKEAKIMDPQQRILLEESWHAFEDAGYKPDEYQGQIGCFCGGGGIVSSYFLARAQDLGAGEVGKTGSIEHIGNDKDFLSTRLSYKLNLKGPAFTVQSACSTSLVALHLACQSIRDNECDMALVAASTIRVPHFAGYEFQNGDILSSDGHCRPFDATATGTIFGSGVTAVIVKSLEFALRDGDQIYAVIKGTAINNDGANKLSYTSSSVEGQMNAFETAIRKAGIEKSSISYIECHGTGTVVGDPIEVMALNRVFSEAFNSLGVKCPIGSVKGNLGHLEQSSGLASLIKTCLMLKNKKILSSINFSTPNPKANFDKIPFYVNTEFEDWQPFSSNRRRALVNNLGLGGTNAVVILEEPPDCDIPATVVNPGILTISAKSESSLLNLCAEYLEFFRGDINLANACYTANTARTHFNHRNAFVFKDKQDLLHQLETVKLRKVKEKNSVKKIAFMFSGQGSQYSGMGKELYLRYDNFKAALDECVAVAGKYLKEDLLRIIFELEHSQLLNQTKYTQPALFCICYALMRFLKSLGIGPDIVFGHSIGEYVAACIAGVMSLEQAIQIVIERGSLMSKLDDKGAMIAVFADVTRVNSLISSCALPLEIAVINSINNTVVAGSEKAIKQFSEFCDEAKIVCRRLTVSNAFHSALMEPALPNFKKYLDKFVFENPEIILITNLTGAKIETEMNAEHWIQHARSTVNFSQSIYAAHELGANLFIEIGPGKMITKFVKDNLGSTVSVLNIMDKTNEAKCLLNLLQNLYESRMEIDFSKLYSNKKQQKISLPTYHFDKNLFWYRENSKYPFLQSQLINFKSPHLFYVNDHRIFNTIILPTTCLIEFLLELGEATLGKRVMIESFVYLNAIDLEHIQSDHYEYKIISIEKEVIDVVLKNKNEDHPSMQARLRIFHPETSEISVIKFENKSGTVENTNDFYNIIATINMNYGEYFKNIRSIKRIDEFRIITEVSLHDDLHKSQAYFAHPALLDACLHIYPAFLSAIEIDYLKSNDLSYLPIQFESFKIFNTIPQTVKVFVEKINSDEINTLIVNLYLLTTDNKTVAILKKLRLKPLTRKQVVFTPLVPDLYHVEWQALKVKKASVIDRDNYLILSNRKTWGDNLADFLLKVGNQAEVIELPNMTAFSDEAHLKQFIVEKLKIKNGQFSKILFVPEWGNDFNNNIDISFSEKNINAYALGIIQAVLQENNNNQKFSPKIWFISHRAHNVIDDNDINPLHHLLWGVARTAALECPNIWGGIIDISNLNKVGPIFSAINNSENEKEIAVRNDNCLVSRLTPLLDDNRIPVKFDADGLYLITGGSGALGQIMISWLANQKSVKHILLVSRNQNKKTIEMLKKNLNAEVDLRFFACDVSSEEEVIKLFDYIQTITLPLRGIIHCAGNLDDKIIPLMDWERFSKVTAPKVLGSWFLHKYSLPHPLHCFIAYSSILSFTGSPGQVNYTAANSFLDGLISMRRQNGLPGVAVGWGPWADAGLATHSGDRGAAIWKRRGTEYLSSAHAMHCLNTILEIGKPIVGVTKTDWAQFLSQFDKLPSFYNYWQFLQITSDKQEKIQAYKNEFEKALPEEKAQVSGDILLELICQLLEIKEVESLETSLQALGFDSLLGIELHTLVEKVFAVRLSPEVLTQAKNIRELTQELHRVLRIMNDDVDYARLEDSKYSPLVKFRQKIQAPCRIFFFPHAGAHPSEFKVYDTLIENAEIIAVQLPTKNGKENGAYKPSIPYLAETIFNEIKTELTTPYMLFGHSMGGLLIYEFVKNVIAHQLPQPKHFFASGVVAPHFYKIPPYHGYSEGELIKILKSIDEERFSILEENTELLKIALDNICRDLEAAYNYPVERSENSFRFDFSITSIYSKQDEFAHEVGVSEWKEYTNKKWDLVTVTGKHNFVSKDTKTIANLIKNIINIEC